MAKRSVRKTGRPNSSQKTSILSKLKPFLITSFLFLFLFGAGYHYRNGLAYYLGFISDKRGKTAQEKQRISEVRNYTLLSKYREHPVGIDVSEYQGTILWDSVRVIDNNFPIRFVFVRATVGMDRPDRNFEDNWRALNQKSYIRGAYHYYRPDENSTFQANLFIKTVKLHKGDFPPVLDIEQWPKKQSMDQLKKGISNWLQIVEQHYGKKPIIYSGEKFFSDFLQEDFSDYTFWIANYNFFVENMKSDWRFWQFTEKGSVNGISGAVDVNIFNGTEAQLKSITLQNQI